MAQPLGIRFRDRRTLDRDVLEPEQPMIKGCEERVEQMYTSKLRGGQRFAQNGINSCHRRPKCRLKRFDIVIKLLLKRVVEMFNLLLTLDTLDHGDEQSAAR